jgi:hypothetical protein
LKLPIFLDVHKVPFSEDHLKELSQSPVDEFGVSHVNLFYNKEADVCFCLLSAPDKVAVENHHDKAGVACEWITEVSMAKKTFSWNNKSNQINLFIYLTNTPVDDLS